MTKPAESKKSRLRIHLQPKDIADIPNPINKAGTEELLPFYALGQKNFERLCARLAATQENVLEAKLFGTQGQAQYGIDVYTQLKGTDTKTLHQCKCYAQDKYKKEDVAEAVYEFLYDGEHSADQRDNRVDAPERLWAQLGNTFVLSVACSLEHTDFKTAEETQKKRLGKFGIDFFIWDQIQLTARLKQQPEIVLDYFGILWVEKVCGIEARNRIDNKFDDFVQIPSSAIQRKKTPSGALRSESRAVKLMFRKQEKREIVEWLCSESTQEIQVFTGIAGIGKTRLLLEMGRILHDGLGWSAGFLTPRATPEEVRRILDRTVPTLIILDYGENRTEQIKVLIEKLLWIRQHPRQLPVRVAVIARNTGKWLENLLRGIANSKQVFNEIAKEILPITNSNNSRVKLWSAAYMAYNTDFGDVDVSPPASPDLTNPIFDRVLAIHMSAMNSAIKTREKTISPPAEKLTDIIDELLNHEARYWSSISERWSQDQIRMHERLNRLMTVISLGVDIGNDQNDSRQLLKLMAQPPILEQLSDDQRLTVAEHLRALYPSKSTYLAPLEPDLLGERLIQKELENLTGIDGENADKLIQIVFGDLSKDVNEWQSGIDRGFSVLTRIVSWNLDAGVKLLERVIHPRIKQLAWVAYLTLPRESTVLLDLNIKCAEYLIAQFDDNLTMKAFLSNDLSIFCRQKGFYDKGLEYAKQAVQTFELLVKLESDSYRAALASAYDTLSVQQSKMDTSGSREALNNSKLAVIEAYKQSVLNQMFPASVMASLLSNLTRRHNDLGQFKKALSAARGAEMIFRNFSDVALHENSGFSKLLVVSAKALVALEQTSEALAKIEEAIIILKPLSQQNPDLYASVLAAVYGEGSRIYRLSGLPEQALNASQLATQILRDLAPHSQVLQREFVISLYELAICYGSLICWQEFAETANSMIIECCKLIEIDDFDFVLGAFQNVFSISKKFAILGGKVKFSELAEIVEQLGDQYRAINKTEQAKQCFELALDNLQHTDLKTMPIKIQLQKKLYDVNVELFQAHTDQNR